MSTSTEQRLTAALAARADQVRDEQLSTRGVPAHAPHRRGRTWVVVTGVAAACAAAIALTFVLLHHDRTAAPALPDTPHRLTGDVDGDGKPDTVTLARTGAVTVRFGDGRELQGLVRTPAELVGLADVGAPDEGIVVAEHPTDDDFGALDLSDRAQASARVATVLVVGDRFLDRAQMAGDLAPFLRTPTSTFWVADGRLLETGWDRTHDARVAIDAGRLVLKGGRLTSVDIGEMCWDRSIEAYPSTCRPGHDFRIDVGKRGALPDLYPVQEPSFVNAEHPMTDVVAGRTVVATLSRSDRAGHAVLEVRVDGKTYRATTPAETPGGSILAQLVPDKANPNGFGVALYFECCDYAHDYVYTLRDGELRLAPVAKGALFGDGFVDGGTRYFHTWQATSGALYTSDGTGHGSRDHVLADELVDGRIEQRSLGWVCADPANPGRWGRCPD